VQIGRNRYVVIVEIVEPRSVGLDSVGEKRKNFTKRDRNGLRAMGVFVVIGRRTVEYAQVG